MMRLNIQAHVAKLDHADKITIGEVMEAIREAQTDEEAQAVRAAYLARTLRERPEYDEATANSVVNENIGYLTGYCDQEEGARILALYSGARHPIFGTRHVEGKVTPEEALEAGRAMAAEQRERDAQRAGPSHDRATENT